MRRRREQRGRRSRRPARRCAAVPRSASAMSRARNPPIARGDRRSSRRSDAPNPGRSTANRRACSASVAHIARERVEALRPGAGQQQRRLLRAAAVGVADPQSVDRPEPRLDRCGQRGVHDAPLGLGVCAHVGSSVPCLLRDHVGGVPVGPVHVVLAAHPLLVLAVRDRRATHRVRQIGGRRERGLGGVDAAGKPLRDLLQQPLVAVGVAEGGEGAVASRARARARRRDRRRPARTARRAPRDGRPR